VERSIGLKECPGGWKAALVWKNDLVKCSISPVKRSCVIQK